MLTMINPTLIIFKLLIYLFTFVRAKGVKYCIIYGPNCIRGKYIINEKLGKSNLPVLGGLIKRCLWAL